MQKKKKLFVDSQVIRLAIFLFSACYIRPEVYYSLYVNSGMWSLTHC